MIPAASRTTATATAATSSTSRIPGWRTSGTVRPPAGCRSARPAPCRRARAPSSCAARSSAGGRSPSGRRGRPGRTGRPRSGRRRSGVSTASTGTPAARARPMTPTAVVTGSRSRPRTPVPSRASTTTPALSIPCPRIETSRETGAWTRVTSVEPVEALPVRRRVARPGPLLGRHEHHDRRHAPAGEAARRDEPVAAVVARPGQDQHRPVLAGVPHGQGVGRGGHGRAGVLHQRLARDPAGLRLAVEARHRLARDRAIGTRPRPTAARARRA